MVRTTPSAVEGAVASGAAATAGAEDETETPEEAVLNRLGHFSGSGKSLRDELADLVHEDTDAAANILKSWIGTAE